MATCHVWQHINNCVVSCTCRVFDRDGNGYITRDELQSAMEVIQENVTENQVSELLNLADLDKDGKINYEGITRLFPTLYVSIFWYAQFIQPLVEFKYTRSTETVFSKTTQSILRIHLKLKCPAYYKHAAVCVHNQVTDIARPKHKNNLQLLSSDSTFSCTSLPYYVRACRDACSSRAVCRTMCVLV